MKFITLASLLTSVAAAPALQTRQSNSTAIPDNTPFGLVSIRSGSDLQYGAFSASQNGLAINLDSQGATCDRETNTATFYLSEGALFLLTPANITQQVYTDRSGMGQGVTQYSTKPGGYGPGRNAETVGWELDAVGDLTFDGAGIIACPRANTTTYSVWVNAGVANPGFSSNCLGVVARAVPATDPIVCTYNYTPVAASS